MGDENNGIPGAEVYLRVEDLLKVLDFTQKQLSELPENILEFKNTEEAILAENSFTVIPSALFELPHLIVCNLSNNRIENFGPIESLAKWKKLQTLRLSFNSIATIPSEITFLSSLKILELENNKILELPEEIGNLSHLTQLNITNNQIEKIPINILNHQTLKYLYCDCNKIEKLPQAPDKFSTKLQKITLCKNPLCLPDPAITQLRNHGVSVLITNPLADSNGTDEVTLLKPIRSTHHKRSYSHAGESTTPTELASPFNRPASFSRQLKRASNSTFGSVRNTRARAQDSPTWKRLKSRESVKRNGYATKQISLASEVSASVTEMDILPKNIKNIATIDYIVENDAASVSAATKEQLIGLLTYDSGIDMVKFQKLFLCTYPTFMGSMEFLDAIVSRFENATKDVTHSRVIMLLALWINIQLVHIRTNVELKNSILSFVNQQCTKDEFTEQLLEITILLNEGIVQNLPTTIGNHWTLVKPKELAKSLCMISHRLLRQIPLTNLIDGQYTRAIDETNPIPLNDFSKWFNIEYNWAASSIILAESAIECAALIQIFIAIISKCIRLHNFSSAMAIYSALNMGAVQRLSTAWSLIAPKNNKLMAEFDRVFSFKMNFGAYRDILKTTSLPCIPLFTVIGRDLTHLEEASPKFIREEEVTKINFERLSGIASHLIYFRNCQIVQFDFNDKNSVTLENQLREIKTYQKEELYEISNANETKHAAEQAAKKKKKPSLRDARESFAKPPASPPSPAPEVLASPNLEKKRQKKRRVKPNEPSAQLPRTRASSVSVKQKQPKRHVNDLFWDDNSILG